eukprot:6213209-Alexandrium_andersonii.AAC.1
MIRERTGVAAAAAANDVIVPDARAQAPACSGRRSSVGHACAGVGHASHLLSSCRLALPGRGVRSVCLRCSFGRRG